MRTSLPDDLFSCITTQGKHTSSWQKHDEGMKTARRYAYIHNDLDPKVCFVNFTGRRFQ
jgi:hypothetical protein